MDCLSDLSCGVIQIHLSALFGGVWNPTMIDGLRELVCSDLLERLVSH